MSLVNFGENNSLASNHSKREKGYHYVKNDEWYVIYDGDKIVTSPAGKPVRTLYAQLAKRIVDDLQEYGYEYHSCSLRIGSHICI